MALQDRKCSECGHREDDRLEKDYHPTIECPKCGLKSFNIQWSRTTWHFNDDELHLSGREMERSREASHYGLGNHTFKP